MFQPIQLTIETDHIYRRSTNRCVGQSQYRYLLSLVHAGQDTRQENVRITSIYSLHKTLNISKPTLFNHSSFDNIISYLVKHKGLLIIFHASFLNSAAPTQNQNFLSLWPRATFVVAENGMNTKVCRVARCTY